MTLSYTDSKSALKPAELVSLLIATSEYHFIYMDAATVAEPDGQV